MNIALEGINWWAVLVAAVATFFLGGLWYGALFKEAWVRLHGYTPEKVKAMQARHPPPLFFSVMLAAYLVVAAVIAVLASAAGIASWTDGLVLGLLLWLGFAAAIGLTAWVASDRPLGGYAIDWGYQLVFLPMMGAIIGAWR